MPRPASLIEYGLYVRDVEAAAKWYQALFGFPTLLIEPGRLHALQAGPQSVLLLFAEGGSVEGVPVPDAGYIPPHDGSGPVHLAFTMDPEEVADWAQTLERSGVEIESTVQWPEGGTSFYFRDLDRHLVELITPRQWKFR
jgi:catechol 2,3-dioxygenase-like lactoylglutathione lyase family enzyme